MKKPFDTNLDATNAIGELVDFILSNIKKNMLNPLKQLPAVAGTPYRKLPHSYINVISNLFHLNGKPITIKELSTTMNVQNSNLTPILNDMERDGLIIRRIAQYNRKYILVELTEKAQHIMREYHEASDVAWEHFLSEHFTLAQLNDLHMTMLKLNAYLNKMQPENIRFEAENERLLRNELFENNE